MTDFQKYQNAAAKAFGDFYSQPYRRRPAENDIPHVTNIGRSIMLHRDGIMAGGGFVTVVCGNDLASAVQKADSVCQWELPFFIHCLLHVHP